MQQRRALSGMVLSLVFLVAALAPGCTDASSPKSLGLGDGSDTERGGNTASSVVVSLDASSTVIGNPIHASAVVKNSRGTVLSGKRIAWSVSDTSMARVEDGVITSKRAGQAVVRANVDAVMGQKEFTVVAAKPIGPVTSVTVAVDSSSLTVPHTAQASATLRDSSGTIVGGSVTWSSSNTSVATVSNIGVISAISAGTANITASSGNATGQAAISITAPVTPIASVVVSLVSNSVNIGATTQATATALDANNNVLTGRTVSWSSSNTAVATVDPSRGIVTGVAAGTASISATSGGKTGATTVTVTTVQAAAVGSVTVALAMPSVNVAGTTQATATVYDVNHNVIPNRAVTWSSANTAVAMVNSTTGVVTGVGAGTASIVATASGISGAAGITVGAPTVGKVATVSVSLVSPSINVNTSTQATATTRDSSNNIITGVAVTWKSSNTAIATVNASTGIVTGVAAGSATITAISSEKIGTASITIMSSGTTSPASVASVSVSLNTGSIVVGATAQATATTRDSANNVLTGRTIAWSSSNTAVATVNASTGAITGMAVGNATITATSGGKSGTATISVAAAPVSSPGSGSYPNRPASFTQSTQIDFSQAIPSLPDNVDRPITGAPGWNMIYFGGNWNQMSDPTAPQSAPGVWRGHWAPGSYGGGVLGQGGGHGIGNVFSYAPAGASRLYMSLRVYFDFAASQWHPISNKFVNIEGDHSQILVQLDEGGNWRHAEELGYTGYNSFGVDFNRNSPTSISGQVDNRAVPTQQWTQIEVLIDFPNHVFKVWQDGVLTTNATPTFASTRINTFGINAFRGGGGETLTTDLYWRYDHFFIAW